MNFGSWIFFEAKLKQTTCTFIWYITNTFEIMLVATALESLEQDPFSTFFLISTFDLAHIQIQMIK